MVSRAVNRNVLIPCRANQASWSATIGHAFCVALAASWCVAAGCGQGRVPQKRVIQIRQADALGQVRSALEGYAQGQPVGSERELFPQFVGEVRKADPRLAGLVENGLAEIEASPSQAARLAKKLLDALGPAPQP